jgi:hypothetical protein
MTHYKPALAVPSFERWQEIGNDPAHTQERIAMEAGAEDLLAIKIRKLGWPNFCI